MLYLAATSLGLTIFVACTHGATAPLLWDDNLTQWYAVTSFAMEQLRAGHFPFWNPYQWAGFRIDIVGYYGVYNPLMFATHLANRVLAWDTLSIYGAVMHTFGTCGAVALGRAFRHGAGVSLLLAGLYAGSLGYFIQSNWYYIFNLFAVMPWLLAAMVDGLDARGRAAAGFAVACAGACMAMTFYLGNVQYGVYACGIGTITWLALGLAQGRGRAALAMALLAGAVCGLLAAPALVEYYRAGLIALFAPAPLLLPSPWAQALLNIVAPPALISACCPETPFYVTLAATPGLGLLAVTNVLFLLWRRSRRELLACAYVGIVVAAVLILADGARVGALIPAVNRFRFAFKWLFAVPPLLLLFCAAGIGGLPRRARNSALGAAAVWLTASVATFVPPPLPALLDLPALKVAMRRPVEGPRHRVVAMVEHPQPSPERQRVDLLRGNGATYYRTPTLSGYDLALEPQFRGDMQALLGDSWNLGWPLDPRSLDCRATAPVDSRTGRVRSLLSSYGVETLLGDATTIALIGLPTQRAASGRAYATAQATARLPDAASLVSAGDGRPLRYALFADGIRVDNVEPADGPITARWWPLSGFRAEMIARDGQHYPQVMEGSRFLQVRPTRSGDLWLHIDDVVSRVALAAGWLVTLASLTLLAWLAWHLEVRIATTRLGAPCAPPVSE